MESPHMSETDGLTIGGLNKRMRGYFRQEKIRLIIGSAEGPKRRGPHTGSRVVQLSGRHLLQKRELGEAGISLIRKNHQS